MAAPEVVTEPMSTWLDRVNELRDELAAADGSMTFFIQLDEAQALDVASGFVPASVQAAVMAMLDFKRADQRRADRPVPTKRKPRA